MHMLAADEKIEKIVLQNENLWLTTAHRNRRLELVLATYNNMFNVILLHAVNASKKVKLVKG